jgi:hypothetical protein
MREATEPGEQFSVAEGPDEWWENEGLVAAYALFGHGGHA